MDKLELRIAALELLAIEILADVDPALREAAAARIRDAVPRSLDGDESTIRQGALGLLEDAAGRHVIFNRGVQL